MNKKFKCWLGKNPGQRDKEYEEYNRRQREYARGKGKINIKARAEAIRLLIRKYKKEFDKLVENLKKEMATEEKTNG